VLRRLDISTVGAEIGQALTPQVTAGNSLKVTVRALDDTMALVTPTTMRYRVDDVNSGQAIADWTSVTPAAPAVFVIPPTINANRNPGYDFERRQLMVEATDAEGTLRDTYDYLLFNTLGTV